MWNIELLGVHNGLRGEARIGNIRIEISIRLLISIRLDHVDLQFSYWNFHTDGYFHIDWYNWPVFHLFMYQYGTPGWTLIVRVFIVVRNKKIVSKIFYFMVEKFEIKARFLIQGWEFHFALPERILIVRVFIVVRNKKNRVQNILFYGWKIWNQGEIFNSRMRISFRSARTNINSTSFYSGEK